jgi:serine/threonine protein kinase
MHLDLKPENILIKSADEYLICDFGCSKVHQSMNLSQNFLKMSLTKGIGTEEYISPEVRKNCQANKYSDVWSLGVIIYKMVYHKTPF